MRSNRLVFLLEYEKENDELIRTGGRRGHPPRLVSAELRPFDPNQINVNLSPVNSPMELKYIGARFAANFVAADIDTLDDLLTYIQTHTRTQNRALLRDVLRNERAGQCVEAARRSYQVGRAPRGQRIRPVNFFAYNSVVTYARAQLDNDPRIPALLQRQTPAQAFPDACLPPLPVPAVVPAAAAVPAVVAPALPARRRRRRRPDWARRRR